MPTKQLNTLAEKYGKSMEEAEKCWEKAKKAANKQYKENSDVYWKVVHSITEKCLKYKDKKKKHSLEDW